MNFIRKFTPIFWIRLGLGTMFAYSGLDIILHPKSWTWALRGLPDAIGSVINTIGHERYLMLQGGAELAMALAFLAWFLPMPIVRFAALFAAIEMAGILLFVGIDAQTFRDIGLLGAALALAVKGKSSI